MAAWRVLATLWQRALLGDFFLFLRFLAFFFSFKGFSPLLDFSLGVREMEIERCTDLLGESEIRGSALCWKSRAWRRRSPAWTSSSLAWALEL
jgi:hypothetical protein